MRRAPPPPPRISKAPPFEDVGVTKHFDRVAVDVSRELQSRIVKTEPVDNLLLMSPGGKVFKVTVDDTGVISTTELAS